MNEVTSGLRPATSLSPSHPVLSDGELKLPLDLPHPAPTSPSPHPSSHARRLFDGMPPAKMGENNEGRPTEMGDLPDELLHHILSFLPAEEAVQTCVLARRWRHLWKFATGLRIGCLDEDESVPVNELKKFVYHLFLLRGGSPLGTCELRIGDFDNTDDESRVNLWFRHAVMCKVRSLTLQIHGMRCDEETMVLLDDLPLVSQHLTRLQLYGVTCPSSVLNFSSCPALEHLEFDYCLFASDKKIMSESLKSLSITNSTFCFRIQIYVPSMVSLHLDDPGGRTPIIESMPSLVEAFVQIAMHCDDCCNKLGDANNQDCNCEYCDSSDNNGDGSNNCVLLKGLSEAKFLVLISKPEMFIFRRDLRWCPTFSKLKTLLLNDYWCMPDLGALACILEHSPILEKLTLQLFSEGPKHEVEMKGSLSPMEQSPAISKHLKIVEVNCEVVDVRVFKVLKFLRTFNIRFSLDKVEIFE